MKKKLLIVCLIVLAVGIFAGFKLGNEVFPPKMDESLIHWTYRGTISDIHSPKEDSYVIALEQVYGQGEKIIHITPDTKILKYHSPFDKIPLDSLQSGDQVWLWTAYYQQAPEVVCAYFSIIHHSR